MRPVSLRGYARFSQSLLALRGARALPELALRGGLGLVSTATWALGRDAPPPAHTVVIVGHQRSGTTWLHRMLASHPDATALPLHALLLPADAVQRPLARLARPAWLDGLQERAFGPLDAVHRMRLHEAEEDEFLLWAAFRSPMNRLDRPWPDGREPEVTVDDVALAYWAQAVARAVRRSGGRYVGKNPHFTHRIPELRAALPGVTVVQLVRNPLQAIPSRMSLIRAIWRRRFPGQELARHHVEAVYATSLRCYRGGLGQADVDLRFEALVADPRDAVLRVHRAAGLPAPEPAWLDGLGAHQRTGATRHRYTLDEFGLSEARVRRDLAPVFARWGW